MIVSYLFLVEAACHTGYEYVLQIYTLPWICDQQRDIPHCDCNILFI